MANITKRGNTYRIRVSVGYDINGKQLFKSMTWKPEPGMTNRQIEKEVKKAAAMFEEEQSSGCCTSSNIKFESFAKQWVEQAEKIGELKPLTLKRLKNCQERTYKAIGHLRMDKITRRHIQSFINSLGEKGVNKHTGEGLSKKSQKLYLNFISDVYEYAISCDMDVKNPTVNVKTVKVKTEGYERKMLSIEENRRFLSLLENEPIKYRAFFTLAVYGGFRRGELLGFEWKDLDLETGLIHVVRTSLFDKERGGTFTGTPKTKGSARSIVLPEAALDVLKEYKEEQTKIQAQIGDQWVNTDRIFISWNVSPMGVDTPRNWLAKFCKKNGFTQVNIHSFRHFNASVLISSGVDIKTVSASLGHSNTTTTLNIYAHEFQDAQAYAGRAVTAALADKLGDKKERKNQ